MVAFNVQDNTWSYTDLPNSDQKREWVATVNLSSLTKVLFIGGYDTEAGGELDTVSAFDMASNSWAPLDN